MTGFWIFIGVLAIGLMVSFTGLLFKIRHWPYAQELIITGSVICGIAIVCIIVNFILLKKPLE